MEIIAILSIMSFIFTVFLSIVIGIDVLSTNLNDPPYLIKYMLDELCKGVKVLLLCLSVLLVTSAVLIIEAEKDYDKMSQQITKSEKMNSQIDKTPHTKKKHISK